MTKPIPEPSPLPTPHSPFPTRPALLAPHRAFTLFELILAIALSATLLMLIGTAINLYLVRVDAGRTHVEEAQLARSILAMIATDVRACTTYQTQDISAVSQLATSNSAFNVDSIDQAAKAAGGATTGATPSSGSSGVTVRRSGNPGSSASNAKTSSGAGGGAGGAAGASGGAQGASGSGASKNSGSNSGGGSGGSGGSNSSNDPNSTSLSPGLNGSLEEMIVDVNRLPRLDEMFPTSTQTTATTTTADVSTQRPSDIKTVRYFIRQGNMVDPSDIAATSLDADAQSRVGGLVRQTIDRAVRATAEQSGNTAVLDSGQVLIAPEVVGVEFRYFDGSSSAEEWNMQELATLPQAVEVRIWIAPSDKPAAAGTMIRPGSSDLTANAHMYSQTIDLPLAKAGGTPTQQADSEGGTSTSGTSTGGTSDSGGFGTGSGGSTTQ